MTAWFSRFLLARLELFQLKMQLEREMEMRESLEKSHSSLICRLEDMEALLEQERAQVTAFKVVFATSLECFVLMILNKCGAYLSRLLDIS